MGDLGDPAWKKPILDAYVSHAGYAVEQIDYFHVIVSMKLLASTVISFLFGPEEVGLRPDTVNVTKEQALVYEQLAQRMRAITGIDILELKDVLEKISEGTSRG
jgi:hypothetical protein